MSTKSKPADASRRRFLKKSTVGTALAAGALNLKLGGSKSEAADVSKLPKPAFTPFVQPLPVPPRLRDAVLGCAPGSPEAKLCSKEVWHGIAPEFDPAHPSHHPDWDRKPLRCYEMTYQECIHEWVPGIKTPSLGFNGCVPGPTFRARLGEPMVIRVHNPLDIESSLHHHGAHSPSHSDGHPCFYTLHGETRDYYYPNCVPRNADGSEDWSESPSTMWYHDHGNDVTAHNVAHGLAGFSIFTDPFEEDLIAKNILPAIDGPDGEHAPYDVPMALTDQLLNLDGTISWDPLDHDGRIGNLFCVNGVVQPFMNVERRKYRLRLLGCSLARIYELRLSNNAPMWQIGNDSWLLPKPVTVTRITLPPGKRADVIVDFSKLPAGSEIYLENIMEQTDGRKPKGISTKNPDRLVKFKVIGGAVRNDITINANTPLRPHHEIPASELVATRDFKLGRSNGAWIINGEFYSPFRADADPLVNSAERWNLTNGSGGWEHPVHIHLESHQITKMNGVRPREVWAYKSDVTHLGTNTTAEIQMRFRTFCGPFVFHCHNNNHEDMRMMKQFEVCGKDPITGVKHPPTLNNEWFSVPEECAGIPHDFIKANPHIFS